MKTSRVKERQTQLGYSMIETLVALASLTLLFGVFWYFSSVNTTRVTYEESDLCMASVQASLDNIRAIGAAHSISTADLNTGNWVPPARPFEGLSSSVLWPQTGARRMFIGSGTPVQLDTSAAFVGSIRVLQDLYNANSAFCTDEGSTLEGMTGSRALLVADSGNGRLRNLQTRLRIERFNLTTGEKSCAGPLSLHPPSAAPIPGAITQAIAQPPPGSSTDVGFWVTVKTSYVDFMDRPRNCEASALFQYPAMVTGFSATAMVMSFTYNSTSIAQCQASMPGGQMEISFPTNFRERGWVPLCRDTSSPSPSYPTTPLCPGGRVRDSFTAPADWRRCEQLTICGVAPVSANWVEPYRLVLRYPALRWGCRVSASGQLVDSAFNVAAAAYSSTMGGGQPVAPLGPPACMPCTSPDTGPGYCPPSAYSAGCTAPPSMDGETSDGHDGGGGSNDGDDSSR